MFFYLLLSVRNINLSVKWLKDCPWYEVVDESQEAPSGAVYTPVQFTPTVQHNGTGTHVATTVASSLFFYHSEITTTVLP